MLEFCPFCDQFEDPNHQDFSYEAKKLLYDYFVQNNLDLEIDAISLGTHYDENTWENCQKEFNLDMGDIDDDDEDAIKEKIKEYLDENTVVVGKTADSIVYESF